MKKHFRIFIILLICLSYAYSARAANKLPSLRPKSTAPDTNKEVKIEPDFKRICDEKNGKLIIEYDPHKYAEQMESSKRTVIFEAKDAISESYRKFPTRKAFSEHYPWLDGDIALMKASQDGEKMSLGAAYDICRSKGMQLPSVFDLTAAYDAQKNLPPDACFFKPDEYAVGGYWVQGYWPKTPSMTFDMAAGKRVDYDDVKELKRVRCIYK